MTHYQLVVNNKRRSFVIILGFFVFISLVLLLVKSVFGLSLGFLGLLFILVGIGSLISYWYSADIILATTKARPAKREEFFDFYTVTENLASSQNLPIPRIYVIDDPNHANAFATGRNPKNAVIVATTGLLQRLNRSELEGVVAHELSHVKNYDILLASLVTIFVGFLILLVDVIRNNFFLSASDDNDDNTGLQFFVSLILILVVPISAKLIQLAISRKRELLADASAVAMTKNPRGLINALKKIATNPKPLKTASGATAHLFIEDPLAVKQFNNTKVKKSKIASWFNTHPPVETRIAALERLLS